MKTDFISSRDQAVDAAHLDAILTLGRYFDGPADERFTLVPDPVTAVLTNENSTAVTWRWKGEHKKRFQGIPVSNIEVVVDGVTVFSTVDGKVMVRRYIDWHHVFTQLGASTQQAVVPQGC